MIDIELLGISKAYNPGLFKKKVHAVNDLSLQVAQGEVYGLIGPNGAGKSSTIRLMLRLTRPDSGHILFRGQPLAQTQIQREIGYLPENPYLYDHLSLSELLTFCGRVSGLDQGQVRQRGSALMEQLSLAGACKRPLRTFSKGMLQRAGICFALLHDPSIVILDEPMSGLDPIGRKMVFDLVSELARSGKTVFFCSHILSDVERLCDRIGLIAGGSMLKEYSRADFIRENSSSIHILTTLLSAEDLALLKPDILKSRAEDGGHLLAVSAAKFYAVSQLLNSRGIKVRGCRSEWVSLEDLFMDVIKEQSQ